MSVSTQLRRVVAEIQLQPGSAAMRRVAGRPLFHFWSVLQAYVRPVLLAPHGRVAETLVSWTWMEPNERKPASSSELARLRERLRDAAAALADAPAADGRESDERNAREAILATASVLEALAAKSDAALNAFSARTSNGLMVHSWGAGTAARPFLPDAVELEVSGAVIVRGSASGGHQVVLEDARGIVVARTRSDGSGRFVFGSLAAGRYRVRGISEQVDFPVTGIAVEVVGISVTGVELKSGATAARQRVVGHTENVSIEKGGDRPAVPATPRETQSFDSRKGRGWALAGCIALAIGAFAIWLERSPTAPTETVELSRRSPTAWSNGDGQGVSVPGESDTVLIDRSPHTVKHLRPQGPSSPNSDVQITGSLDAKRSRSRADPLGGESSGEGISATRSSPLGLDFPRSGAETSFFSQKVPLAPGRQAGVPGHSGSPLSSGGIPGGGDGAPLATSAEASSQAGRAAGDPARAGFNGANVDREHASAPPNASPPSTAAAESGPHAGLRNLPSSRHSPSPPTTPSAGLTSSWPAPKSEALPHSSGPVPAAPTSDERESNEPATPSVPFADVATTLPNELPELNDRSTERSDVHEAGAENAHVGTSRSDSGRTIDRKTFSVEERRAEAVALPLADATGGPLSGEKQADDGKATAARLLPAFQVTVSPWRMALARDGLIATRPVPDGRADDTEARRVSELRGRQAGTPAGIANARQVWGIAAVFRLPPEREDGELAWVDSSTGRPAASGIASVGYAEMSWNRVAPSRGQFELKPATGDVIARIAVDAGGRVSVLAADGVRTWSWLAVERGGERENVGSEAWNSRLAWKALGGRKLDPSWTSSIGGSDGRIHRLDLPLDASRGANLLQQLALVDSVSGWGWVVVLQQVR